LWNLLGDSETCRVLGGEFSCTVSQAIFNHSTFLNQVTGKPGLPQLSYIHVFGTSLVRMFDFTKYVEHSGLNSILQNILRKYDAESWNTVSKAAACHFYTTHEIPIDHRMTVLEEDPDIRSLLDTFRNGGNCVDKSVFLASLLTHVDGVETRFSEIERRPDGHILLDTRFPCCDREEVEEELLNFYQQNHDFGTYQFAWEKRYGKPVWVVTDPGLSRYIGDVEALSEEGYAETEEDDWGWSHPTQTQPV